MITSEIDYLDGEFSVQEEEPSTIQELIDLIGEDAVVQECVSNLRYRNKYPRVYKKVSKEIEKNWPRAVKKEETKKDGTVKKILENENDHLRSALFGRKDEEGTVTTAAPEESREKLQELFTTIARSEPLYVKGERTGGGGKISQAALDAANGIIAGGDDNVEEKIEYIEKTIPGYKVGRDADGAPTPESIARGVQALQKHLANKAMREAKAAMGVPA